MATVTFLDEANMVQFPADSGGGHAASESTSECSVRTSSGFNAYAFGDFSLLAGGSSFVGTIDRVITADHNDDILLLDITGLSYDTGINDVAELMSLQPAQFIFDILAGADTVIGSKRDDTILGFDGNDTLLGGAGADVLEGGNGTNTASYATAKSGVFAGLDAAASNTGDAAGDFYAGIQSLIGSAFDDILQGDSGKNVLTGGGGKDTLVGDTGADTLLGGPGTDTLFGGAGRDVLAGGSGKDALTGNLGADTFQFDKVSDSPTSNRDVIEDFTRSEGDMIDVSKIDANTAVAGNQAFEFIGTGNFTGNAGDPTHRGELRYVELNGNATLLVDVNGDSTADFAVRVLSVNALLPTDFIL